MDKQMTFKTQMFGFDKKMVIDYIADAYQQSSAEAEKLNARVGELETENEKLKQQAQEATQSAEQLQERFTTETSNAMRLAEAVRTLTAEINRQKLDQNQKDYKIKQLSEQIEDYEAQKDEADKVRREADRILSDAKIAAAEIVEKAKSQGGQIVRDAEEEHQKLLSRMDDFRGDIDTLKAALKETLREIEQKIDGIDFSLEKLPGRDSDNCEEDKVKDSDETGGEAAEYFFRPAAQR